MITIKAAIERLQGEASLLQAQGLPRRAEAIQLGIEALKRIHSKRITMSYHPDDLLPGETNDKGGH